MSVRSLYLFIGYRHPLTRRNCQSNSKWSGNAPENSVSNSRHSRNPADKWRAKSFGSRPSLWKLATTLKPCPPFEYGSRQLRHQSRKRSSTDFFDTSTQPLVWRSELGAPFSGWFFRTSGESISHCIQYEQVYLMSITDRLSVSHGPPFCCLQNAPVTSPTGASQSNHSDTVTSQDICSFELRMCLRH